VLVDGLEFTYGVTEIELGLNRYLISEIKVSVRRKHGIFESVKS